MGVDIDLNYYLSLIPSDNPLLAAWFLFIYGGWVLFVITFIWAAIYGWLVYKRTKYYNRWEWVTLSIDIPRNIEQHPKAVEYLFAALAGTWKHIDWLEKAFTGKVQISFSFELISIDGYIQFIIRAPRHYKDLVEAAVYAQYPGAEITEVPDYTEGFNIHWPKNDQGYDIWGTEMTQLKKYYYPIRTYVSFLLEDRRTFQDPMNGVLETIAKLKKGEQFWFQIIVTPANNKSFQERGKHFVERLSKKKTSKGLLDYIGGIFVGIIDAIIHLFIARPESEGEKKKEELTEKEKAAIEAVQNKLSKLGFRITMRVVYIARKEVFDKNKVKEGFLGALHQFTDLNLNGLVQNKYTKVSPSHLYYFRKFRVEHYRKNHILYNYKIRHNRKGARFGHGFILNTEELASLWHFPVGVMQTLILKKVDVKKAEAPYTLPVETPRFGPVELEKEERVGLAEEAIEPEEVSIEKTPEPPGNLPID